MRKTIQEQRQQNLLFGPIFIDADLICLLVSKERSEEHTSELQSQSNLVCRLLLEKKKQYSTFTRSTISLLEQAPSLPCDASSHRQIDRPASQVAQTTCRPCARLLRPGGGSRHRLD